MAIHSIHNISIPYIIYFHPLWRTTDLMPHKKRFILGRKALCLYDALVTFVVAIMKTDNAAALQLWKHFLGISVGTKLAATKAIRQLFSNLGPLSHGKGGDRGTTSWIRNHEVTIQNQNLKASKVHFWKPITPTKAIFYFWHQLTHWPQSWIQNYMTKK